jgi:alpha-1,2-glucosyltransferase
MVSNIERRGSAVLLLLVFCVGLWIIASAPLQIDEPAHLEQIRKFLGGDFKLGNFIAVLPGYHLVTAFLARVLSVSSDAGFRVLTSLYGLLALAVAGVLSRELHADRYPTRIWQVFLFPLVFLFLFLLYTDILSLAFVLIAFLLGMRRRHAAAAFVGLLAILVRQTNIVWLVFIASYVYLDAGLALSRQRALVWLQEAWPYALVIGMFVIFTLLNRGVAIGDRKMHLTFSFHAGNVFMFLIAAFVTLLPVHVAHAAEVVRLLRQHAWVRAALALGLATLVFGFHTLHPYNDLENKFFLRHRVLALMFSSNQAGLLFFLPIAYAAVSLAASRFERPQMYLLYPFLLVYLASFWLIEPRYYIVPFVLFLLFRRQEGLAVEITLVVWLGFLSIATAAGYAQGLFIP